MTEEEMNEEVRRQVALHMTMMQPTIVQLTVTQAVVTAILGVHPDPATVRQRAESLLMQGQVSIATKDAPPLLLPGDQVPAILDYLFRPVKYVDPE